MATPVLAIVSGLILLFLCSPIAVVVPMSFSSASALEFPPPGFSLRWYEAFLSDAEWLTALQTSLIVALTASALALVLGSLAAYGLTRGAFRGRTLVELNFVAPMIVPHIVTAIAFYLLFARMGILGSLAGLIIAHAVLAVPCVVLVMTVALRSFDVRIEQVAYTLGASRPAVLRRILMPNLMPSLVAAWIFAFITSFDEVTVTIFLAGIHETVPKRMFSQLMVQIDPVITVVATLLIVLSMLSVATIALLLRRSGARPAAR